MSFLSPGKDLALQHPGELYDQIHRRKKIDAQDVQFYAAEIVLMLKRLRQEQASLVCCR